jgi:hypothetical protein
MSRISIAANLSLSTTTVTFTANQLNPTPPNHFCSIASK